jgi:hypothetical protein
MAQREKRGGERRITETPEEATQADNSTAYVLIVSLILAVLAGLGLFWYFGIFPFPNQAATLPG